MKKKTEHRKTERQKKKNGGIEEVRMKEIDKFVEEKKERIERKQQKKTERKN